MTPRLRISPKGPAALFAALVIAAPVQAAGTEDEAPSYRARPAPSLNFYGSPGLIDMPSAEMLPEGQFTTSYSWFGGQSRLTATFQAMPWLSGSFRYNGIQNWNLGGFATYYDRGFDVRFRLMEETRRWPQITLGLQDFVGTGIYAAEYIVATKTFSVPSFSPANLPGRLKLTAGAGWGRLGPGGPADAAALAPIRRLRCRRRRGNRTGGAQSTRRCKTFSG